MIVGKAALLTNHMKPSYQLASPAGLLSLAGGMDDMTSHTISHPIADPTILTLLPLSSIEYQFSLLLFNPKDLLKAYTGSAAEKPI